MPPFFVPQFLLDIIVDYPLKTLKNLLFVWILCATSAYSADQGTTGLIDTPTARMRADGEFSAGISRQPLVDIYSISYQATPWLETTFRYSAFEDGLYDRSYEVKLRLLKEGRWKPEVAMGARDLLGTGVWGSEYLVANKTLGAFDISLGLGWGRLADRAAFSNPLAEVWNRFADRDPDFGLGGTVQFDSFFAGPEVGIFGGVAYELENQKLRFLAEYNSDAYEREVLLGTAEDPSPFSYGVEWSGIEGITIGLSHQFGEEWAFSLSSSLDSLKLPEKTPPSPYVSSLDYFEAGVESTIYDFSTWYDRLLFDMRFSGLNLHEASTNSAGTEVTLIIENRQYAMAADAVQQALSLAELHLPGAIGDLNLVLQESGIRPITLNYRRVGADAAWSDTSGRSINILRGRDLVSPETKTAVEIGKVSVSAGLGTRFQFFDPDDPLRYQLLLRVGTSAPLGQGWIAKASYALDIDNNFDEIVRGSDSVLPHVRSDSGLYLQQGASGLEALYVEKRDNLASDVYYRLYGGVLEDMYSGIGGELLIQPFRSRLAWGFSANWVKQRDYDKSFSHLDYDTVTAFASLYWATPWYNYDIAVHAGQYLAKDIGVTFDVRRTLDNGWQVGAWATLTDVPFEEFGEGSFDKGLYFRIPLQSLFGINTRLSSATALRSIQRDGGQRLEGFSGNLWYDLRSTRYDAIDNHRDRMIP